MPELRQHLRLQLNFTTDAQDPALTQLARFEPHRRLLKELVGSNLYPHPGVFIRELVQNAWDAIQWRAQIEGQPDGHVLVSYSNSERWVEVADNGLGMTATDVTESLLQGGVLNPL